MVRDASGRWSLLPDAGAREGHRATESRPGKAQVATARNSLAVPNRLATSSKDLPLASPRREAPAVCEVDSQSGYYSARAEECRLLAEAAADRSIAIIHLEMATRYELLAREQAEEPKRQRVAANG